MFGGCAAHGKERRLTGFSIAIGGALGAIARFAVGGWVTTWASAPFPWATFAINVSGSFLLGFIHQALPPRRASPRVRGFLGVGFCGGFTTFSTFDFETLALIARASYASAATYSIASVVTCVAAIFVGIRAAARLDGTAPAGTHQPSAADR